MLFKKLYGDISDLLSFLNAEINCHELKGITLVVAYIIVMVFAGIVSDLLRLCGCFMMAEIAFYGINLVGAIYCYHEAKTFFKIDA